MWLHGGHAHSAVNLMRHKRQRSHSNQFLQQLTMQKAQARHSLFLQRANRSDTASPAKPSPSQDPSRKASVGWDIVCGDSKKIPGRASLSCWSSATSVAVGLSCEQGRELVGCEAKLTAHKPVTAPFSLATAPLESRVWNSASRVLEI